MHSLRVLRTMEQAKNIFLVKLEKEKKTGRGALILGQLLFLRENCGSSYLVLVCLRGQLLIYRSHFSGQFLEVIPEKFLL